MSPQSNITSIEETYLFVASFHNTRQREYIIEYLLLQSFDFNSM